MWTRAILAAIALFALSTAHASDEPLVSELEAFVVDKTDDGGELLEKAASVLPGDVIEYRMQYRNQGDDPIVGLIVTGPVPAGVQYVAASAATDEPHDLEVSIDNGKSWQAEPVTRVVVDESGDARTEIVPPSDYTHLRWVTTSALAPDTSQLYRYRVQVDNQQVSNQ